MVLKCDCNYLALNLFPMEYKYTNNALTLLRNVELLPKSIRQKVDERAKEFLDSLAVDAGKFLHNDLNCKKHSEEEVRALVSLLPAALSQRKMIPMRDAHTYEPVLPIQSASFDYEEKMINFDATPFIPLLAQEGRRLQIGAGEGGCGGLYAKDRSMESSVFCRLWRDGSDARFLLILQKLHRLHLLPKDKIREMVPLNDLCNAYRDERFAYLIEMDPQWLKEWRSQEGYPLVIRISKYFSTQLTRRRVCLAIKAGLRHFPNELGLLFQTTSENQTSFRYLIDMFGFEETWNMVNECLEEYHASLVSKDPSTNLYPFILAATGATSEISFLYYLIRLDPTMLGD